jgi:hypothetical protein
MRGLNGNIRHWETAQSYTPFVEVSFDGVDYWGTNHLPNRLIRVIQKEKPYGGEQIVTIRTPDTHFAGIDYRGKKVITKWGFLQDDGTPQYHITPPMWVYSQRDISFEGELAAEFHCIDIWNKMEFERLVSGGVDLMPQTGYTVGLFQPGMWVVGKTSGMRGLVLYANRNYISVGNLMRTINNGASSFSTGERIEYENDPTICIPSANVTGWGGSLNPGWNKCMSIWNIITSLLSGFVECVLDNSDGIIDSSDSGKWPTLYIENNAKLGDVFKDLMNRTKCGCRMGSDGKLHFFSVAADPEPAVYFVNQSTYFSEIRDRKLLLPNRFIVLGKKYNTLASDNYEGVADDAAAQAQYGRAITQVEEVSVNSDQEAQSVAESMLRRAQLETTVGEVEAQMNCHLELFDMIEVTDNRFDGGLTHRGWVGGIEREYREGYYRIRVSLGGMASAVGLPGGSDFPLPNFPTPIVPKTIIPGDWPNSGGYAELFPYLDLTFDSSAYNVVTWTGGTVRFADGRYYNIAPGSRTMSSVFEYLYFTPTGIGNTHHLIATTDLALASTGNNVLVANISQGPNDPNSRALIIPVRGKAKWSIDQFFDSADPSGYGRVRKASLVTSGPDMGMVFLDAIKEGTKRAVKSSALNADGLVLLNQTVFTGKDGNLDYALVKSTDVQAGSILLNKTIQGNGAYYMSDGDRGTLNDTAKYWTGELTAEHLKLDYASNNQNTGIKVSSTLGVTGYNQGTKTFEIRNTDGRAYFAGGRCQLTERGLGIGGSPIRDGGITIYGDVGSAGLLLVSGGGRTHISSYYGGGIGIVTENGGSAAIDAAGNLAISGSIGRFGGNLQFSTNIMPVNNLAADCGTWNNSWREMHAGYAHMGKAFCHLCGSGGWDNGAVWWAINSIAAGAGGAWNGEERDIWLGSGMESAGNMNIGGIIGLLARAILNLREMTGV